jgi:protein TonB
MKLFIATCILICCASPLIASVSEVRGEEAQSPSPKQPDDKPKVKPNDARSPQAGVSTSRRPLAKGMVKVKVLIDEKGNVISARAVSGLKLLREDAVERVRKMKFEPTLHEGRTIQVEGWIVVNYTLEDEPTPAQP